jgi:hypothetical protein
VQENRHGPSRQRQLGPAGWDGVPEADEESHHGPIDRVRRDG